MTVITDRRAGELRAMATKLLQMASAIESDQSKISQPVHREKQIFKSWDAEDSEVLSIKASEMYRARRRRQHYLDHDLFGEPAWDLLLDLFIARLQKKMVSVSSACIAADVPPTTALRWLGVLVETNLIERFDSETDQRVSWVRLTDNASQDMAEFFRDLIQRHDKPTDSSDLYLIESIKIDKKL